MTTAYFCHIEIGRRNPTSDAVLERLALALDLPADVVWFAAGRIPPDLRGLDVGPEDVRRAFAALRAALNAESPS